LPRGKRDNPGTKIATRTPPLADNNCDLLAPIFGEDLMVTTQPSEDDRSATAMLAERNKLSLLAVLNARRQAPGSFICCLFPLSPTTSRTEYEGKKVPFGEEPETKK
jgi:hypothetical protein